MSSLEDIYHTMYRIDPYVKRKGAFFYIVIRHFPEDETIIRQVLNGRIIQKLVLSTNVPFKQFKREIKDFIQTTHN